MDKNSAVDVLNKYRKNPKNTSLRKNRLETSGQYALQIVIPAYNAELWIEECLLSILSQQAKYKVKVVVVNDGSTDSTREKLAAIVERTWTGFDITVIDQENRGFSGARNRALETISADYITFVDSDDRMCMGAIDKLLDKAYAENLDIVEGSYRQFRGHSVTWEHIHQEDERQLSGFPWGKVYRSTLWESTIFPQNYWFEDTVCCFLIHRLASKIAVIPDIVYEWRKNEKSISHTASGNPRTLDSLWITSQLLEDGAKLGLTYDAEMLDVFLYQVRMNFQRSFTLFSAEINEAQFILSCALLSSYFPDVQTCSSSLRAVEESMRCGNFREYFESCLL